jgi:hypothetical protein
MLKLSVVVIHAIRLKVRKVDEKGEEGREGGSQVAQKTNLLQFFSFV